MMNQSGNFCLTSRISGSAVVDSLDKAILYLNQAIQADNSYLDLSDRLLVPKHNEPSLSGFQENDYPSLVNFPAGGDLHEIGQIKKTSLPPELVERFAFIQCNCLMGLFPEIKRAWLSIDSDIFMWNYEDGSDVAYFDGLSETILCAGLIRPRPGIFQPHIVYLLCLATAVDIVLLGVSFGQTGSDDDVHNKYEEMHLLPEPLFSIPTDNVHMNSIQSTESGRIFLAGRDGCLHELFYQAEDGWFSRRCRKINHSKSRLSFIVPSFFNFTDDDPLVQIVIDDSRHLLYTLSEKGSIQLFDYGDGANCQTARCVAAMSHQTIVHNATLIARNVEKSNFQPIVNISPVTKAESTNINLVAVTHSGTRLYFTATSFSGSKVSSHRASIIGLVHVRLPPGYTIQARQGPPMNVHSALYSRGVVLLASSQSEDTDNLWVLSDDAFPFQRQISESQEVIPLVGRTWLMAESCPSVPPSLLPVHVRAVASVVGQIGSYGERPDPPAVVTQHLQIDRQFIIVNSLGTTILTKLSPVGQLLQLLTQFGPDSEQVKSYFRLHKEQACATCLVLMCSRSLVHLQVNDLATRAFFLYSGEPDYASGVHNAQPGLNSSHAYPLPTSTPISNVTRHLSFTSPGASAIVPPRGVADFPPASGATNAASVGHDVLPQFGSTPNHFSYKHKSLYLYLGRLLRPFWQNRMVTELVQVLKTKERITHLTSMFDGEQLMWILHKLAELKDFIDLNSTAFATASAVGAVLPDSLTLGQNLPPPSAQRTPGQVMAGAVAQEDLAVIKRYMANAEAEESISLKQLQQLLNLCCEYLGLWKILCDHQFNIIARALSQDQQLALHNVTLELLITNGRDVCQALATHLVEMYINDNAATDIITTRLRDICPSLYSCHDEVYAKGTEKLKSAKSVSGTERDHFLAEALEQFKIIATKIDLPAVATQLASLKFYRGIVDLVMTCASKRDPQNLALHFYLNKRPPSDIQGLQSYNIRMDCYRVIIETMEYLLSTTHFNPQAPSVPKAPGPPPAHDAGRLSSAEAERYIEEMYDMILCSTDQLVHVAFYDWLICKNMPEKLLEVESPYLEQYLKQRTGTSGDSIQILDLLWKYFEKQRNFSAAARILASLADNNSCMITLSQRIEYLSRATMCAKSCTSYPSVPGEGEFLHELEEKMEVARLQLQISDLLAKNHSNYRRSMVDQALERLNSQLLEISVLYSDFAEVFEIPECKLAIVHCAGHFDPTLVETLWREIIDKELEMTAALEPRVRVQSLYGKLVSQGKKYVGIEQYFPIVTLVKYLEKLSCNVKTNFSQTDATFVFRAMLDVGVGFPRLFDIYNKIYKSKDVDWKANRQPYHLLHVISLMLSHFISRPQLIPSSERRPFVTKVLDAVASYLVELQADTTTNVVQLMAELRDLQSRLQRVD